VLGGQRAAESRKVSDLVGDPSQLHDILGACR
jgi:hypothetical protein